MFTARHGLDISIKFRLMLVFKGVKWVLNIPRVWGRGIQKYMLMIEISKSFMKFIFSTVHRVTQNDFYARPYTSMWAPVVARQISKQYSSSCHVLSSM